MGLSGREALPVFSEGDRRGSPGGFAAALDADSGGREGAFYLLTARDVEEVLGKEQAQNLDLIMEVPLQVSVEIGRTQRKVQEILSFSKGSLVVLDKLAGDQVDLFVNGKCIARGDVVVIDDNFGVRVTEIVQNPGFELPKKK